MKISGRKLIRNSMRSRDWRLLIGWLPYFVLLGMSIDWRWSAIRREFGTVIDMVSGQYLYISVTPCGPRPHAEICCLVWAFFAAFTLIYCGLVRAVGLWRKKKNYMAFAIPFGIIFLYASYLWLWADYVLVSYIHQMGMTPARGRGLLCLAAGLGLWCIASALLAFPWERRFPAKAIGPDADRRPGPVPDADEFSGA